MIRFVSAAILLVVSACVSAEEQRVEFSQNCAGYGFTPGTDAYATCMQRETHAQEAREKEAWNTMADSWEDAADAWDWD